jgi:uncharacterized repeat protein (TIGR01451 family)
MMFGFSGDTLDNVKIGNPVKVCPNGPPLASGGHFGTPQDRQAANCIERLVARHLTFRYVLFGHDLLSTPGKFPTGQAEINGNDLVVTLGPLPMPTAGLGALKPSPCRGGEAPATCVKRVAEAGTLLHELGHTLGLLHGGGDIVNCKPNYLSVMSYSYQFPWRDPKRPLTYSAAPTLSALNETQLNEAAGIGGPANRNVVYGIGGTAAALVPANGPVDWNGINGAAETNVTADINYINPVCPQQQLSTLHGFDDWANLRLGFIERSASFNNGVRLRGSYGEATGEELGLDDMVTIGNTYDIDGDGRVANLDNCPDTANPTQADADSDGYGDACDPGDQSAPSVSITMPSNGAEFSGGSNITIMASASDTDGSIVAVRLAAGSDVLEEDLDAPYSTIWANAVPGVYSLTAQATDDNNATTLSAPVSITVHGADLRIAKSDAGIAARWEQPLTYTIVATNPGPDAVATATVTDDLASSLHTVTWSCSATSGSSCTASGAGDIADAAVNLLPGASVTYTVTGTVTYGTVGPIPNSASVSSSAYDPYSSNNQAAISTAVDSDRIFEDGLETGDFSRWRHALTDGGDLSVSSAAALNSTGFGLQALVDDVAGIFVQDDFPFNENRYRARFYFDPNGFDPGVAQGHLRTRIFIGFEENPNRRLFAVVLRRLNGLYSLMGRVRTDDNVQHDTGWFAITDAPHLVEIDWMRASGPSTNDGYLKFWLDGALMTTVGGLDSSISSVDFVRLGALSVKTGAAGTMYWDEFESRRLNGFQ